MFLGAGASYGATSPTEPKKPPTGPSLARLLSNKFLGGQATDKSLAVVAEYCISTSDLRTVQNYIREIFLPFQPSDIHKKVADFRWAALVTTNYDQILEKAYSENRNRLQLPVPILRNVDRVDYELRSPNAVPLLKLHGCISIADDERYPLILTIDQYVTHRKGRDKLFARFTEYAGEYIVVFIGYRLEDPDIRAVLLELDQPGVSRPRHYVVSPNVSGLDEKVWNSKNISILDGTFDDFINELEKNIPAALRSIASAPSVHPITSKFSSHATLSQDTLEFLSNDATYIYAGMTAEQPDSRAFFRGSVYGWSFVIAEFDAKRNLTDTILSEVVLIDDSDRPRQADFYLLKGYAGSGKTVVLKRIAYEAGVTFGKPVLYIKSDARLFVEPIEELCRLLGERLFLFIDGAARRSMEMESFVRGVQTRKLPLTILISERTNEWNVDCQNLSQLLDDDHELRSLSIPEIDALLAKLEANNALGELTNKTHAQRQHAFLNYADRQLLVALYEVTSGSSFPDIIFNEYRNIVNDRARQMYLVICALNRLNVPVRAGLVNRITGISFHDFKQQFFSPLESVVMTEEYKPALDMAYRARHPWIAQIVFERALPVEAERFDLYISLIKAIDVGYTADRSAYRELIRARNLLEIFPTPQLVQALFEAAEISNDRDGYLHQQRAIYEMKRPNPNLERAYEYLAKARDLLPYDKSITHSMAELELSRAQVSQTEIERDRHLLQAKSYAAKLTGANSDSSHGYATLVKLELEKFRGLLSDRSSTDEELAAGAKAVEKALSNGFERFHLDEHLLTFEAEFSQLLHNGDRALKALVKANKINPASQYVAKSLSRLLENKNDFEGARQILSQTLNILPGDKGVNASLARLIDNHFPSETMESEACWRRSFTKGDTNYSSQYFFARRLWLNGKIDEANEIFSALKLARVSRDDKTEIAGWIKDGANMKRYTGIVYRKEDDYAWVTPEGQSRSIFLHCSNVKSEVWAQMKPGNTVTFSIGFNYMGPAASMSNIAHLAA